MSAGFFAGAGLPATATFFVGAGLPATAAFLVGAGLPATGAARCIPAPSGRAQARSYDNGRSMMDSRAEMAA